MRPGFILSTLACAALALALVFHVQGPSPLPAPPSTAPLSSAQQFRPTPLPLRSPLAPALEQKQADTGDEISRLQAWSADADPASLAAILRDLTHPEKQVRSAALEAAKQFGSREAIPALKAAAANAPELDEQIALLEAADFLSLPAIADNDVQVPRTPDQIQATQQWRNQEAARRQAHSHPFDQN